MNIQISKEVYDKLSKDDKLRYIYIKTDSKFEKLILQARKNLGIPPESWNNIENNQYGQGWTAEANNFLFTANKAGELVPYGNWAEGRKIKKSLDKKISKEVTKLINKYPILDSKWISFFRMLICYDLGNFFPDKYSFAAQDDGSVQIYINSLTTPSDFTKWVKSNWKHIANMSKLSVPTHIKTSYIEKSFIPEYESLDDVIKIIGYKRSREKTAQQIAEEIDKKVVTRQESRINKVYHRINKQLKKLENEVKDRQKIETSLFGNR